MSLAGTVLDGSTPRQMRVLSGAAGLALPRLPVDRVRSASADVTFQLLLASQERPMSDVALAASVVPQVSGESLPGAYAVCLASITC
jgi:hypothetical protein